MDYGPLIKNDKEEGYSVKFVLVGDSEVGKTNIVNLYVDHKNEPEYTKTLATEYKNIIFTLNEDTFKLKIVDTSGDKKFLDFIKDAYENANFVIIVFDVTNKNSFLSVNKWIKHCRSSKNENIKFILVGNKNDLEEERKISQYEASSFAEKNGMIYYDISAFKEEDVRRIFDEAFNSFYEGFIKSEDKSNFRRSRIDSVYSIQLNRKVKKKISYCC